MIATTGDLKRHFGKILRALEQRECVTLLHRGKVTGTIVPLTHRATATQRVEDHPLFGMLRDDAPSVDDIMDELRGGRSPPCRADLRSAPAPASMPELVEAGERTNRRGIDYLRHSCRRRMPRAARRVVARQYDGLPLG